VAARSGYSAAACADSLAPVPYLAQSPKQQRTGIIRAGKEQVLLIQV
jgi:hypothetical protein